MPGKVDRLLRSDIDVAADVRFAIGLARVAPV
jgi:hypothetical protein